MTLYPNGIDSTTQIPEIPENSVHVAINALRLAVIAIETELGITPKETYSDVAARLVGIENFLDFPAGNENDVVGLNGVGGLKNLGPAVAIPAGGVAGQFLASDGVGGLVWIDPPTPSGGGFTSLADIAWTGWWAGDDYNATSGVIAGMTSAGTSGGRDFSAPGTKPAKGNTVNGHDGIIFTGTNKHLVGTFTWGDLFNVDQYTVYIVARYNGYGASGGEGYALPSILCDTGSYWSAGGADGATPKKAVAYHTDSISENARGEIIDGIVHLLEITYSNVDGVIAISIDGAESVTQSASDVNSTALTGTMLMGCDYNAGYSSNLTGTIYEVCCSDADLSASATDIRIALADKYGITLV